MRDLDLLLASLHAARNPGAYAFCSVPPGLDTARLAAIGVFHEREGLTAILPEESAAALGLPVAFRAAWITLTVHSDLEAVGLTAAVAAALAAEGISCNVVAAVNHDHLFVPIDRADAALAALDRLQALGAARRLRLTPEAGSRNSRVFPEENHVLRGEFGCSLLVVGGQGHACGPYKGDRMAKKSAKAAKKSAKSAAKGGAKAAKKAPARKANAAFMKPVTPSATLAAVVGDKPIPRTEVTKRLWAYIKKNGLQDPKNKRMIRADDTLKNVFGGKAQVNMFEMTKLVGKHLK
jgi:hypothetical protein